MGKIILIGMYLILFSPYTFFATIAINCSFDYSEIVYTDAMVFDKYSEETDDYLTLYYADVELPDINRAATYVILPKKRWDDTVEGQQLKLGVRKGLLGIDWTWEQELKNNITLHFSVLDKNSTYPLIRSHAVITNSSFADTVYFDSKSIDFQLELENNYSVEFRSEGYQSKTILFNTRNVPVQDQTKDFPFELMKVSLIPQEGQYHNDTVAKFWYNTEVNDFYYEKTNGEN